MLSPWLHELNRIRPISQLKKNTVTDVAIVGAGIAGVTTAYFTLKYTKHSVTLIDSNKVAHGATGHNAGQITSYFERPFSEIVDEFGLEKAVAGQKDIEGAWQFLDEIVADTQIITPIYQVTGYAGFATSEKIYEHLYNNLLKVKGGVIPEMMYIALEWLKLNPLPAEYLGLYSTVPQEDVLHMLETKNVEYIACVQGRKGCTNSARLCEELVGWMLSTYPDRFILAEHTHMQSLTIGAESHTLATENVTITSQYTVLCTNGFTHFDIIDSTGDIMNSRFHHMIHGVIGYMVGYNQDTHIDPTAKSYFPRTAIATDAVNDPDAYFYLTRRPFARTSEHPSDLVCLGGPEKVLEKNETYSSELPHIESALSGAREFLSKTLDRAIPEEFDFQWHGLMGYTSNSLRRIGPEPKHPKLLYNLGCNGVGILPSIFGARRISKYLNNELLESSIFDIPK